LLYGAELAFNVLALDSGIAEALSEEVLGAVSSAVAAIPTNRDHQALVFLVVGKALLEAVCQVEEFFVVRNLALKQHRLHLGLRRVLHVNAESARLSVAEVAARVLDQGPVGLLVAGAVAVVERALEQV
jgi:hypothetical protein